MKLPGERYIASAALMGVLITGCSSENRSNTPEWELGPASITVEEGSTEQVDTRLAEAVSIAGKLIVEFECEGDFTFAALEDISASPQENDGEISVAVADVLNNTITFNEWGLINASEEQFNNIVSHETAHLCAGPETELPVPIDTGDELKLRYAIGFGLSTHADGADEFYHFSHLEEGFASFVGDSRTEGFKADTPYYSFVSERFASLLDFGGLSVSDAQNFHANSDIDGFFAAVLKKDVSALTNDDRLQILGGFNFTD